MRRRLHGSNALVGLLALALASLAEGAAPWVHSQAEPGDFPLVAAGRAAEILISAGDFKVVSIAAGDFAADVERVTGVKARVRTDPGPVAGPFVLAGTLGHCPALDALVTAGRLDVRALEGQWESFLIATVRDPVPGVGVALVVAGSDRRGTAFGLFELSQAIGVSPWHWWADVAPARMRELHVAAGVRRLGPPSVRYRGIFINDEDWGLQPWAAKTFAPEDGGIGPKTYAKVFELLLRLKANTLWPAMHKCTRPFNDFAADAPLADDYGIVMGSSHAEPMLRDNVGEWLDRPEAYDYLANPSGVRRYWDERAAANGRYENIYTLGMRGIHDSMMVGPKTDAERVAALERIFADQREILARRVNPRVAEVPQMFCPYKEVLGLYRQGLKVPDDVTIVWPDDNFGYIRDFPSAAERTRPGGFGVYYHLSYLGRPMAYLWLCTTPPALVWEEMSKAYDLGARRLWIVNVGDLKPAEIETEFFLQMAWDIHRWDRGNLPTYLREWAARDFGPVAAPAIAAVMEDYYRLNAVRRPEQLQWWLPGEDPRPSPLGESDAAERLHRFSDLVRRTRDIAAGLPAVAHDAFEELVGYPVRASALANERYFLGERAALHGDAAAAAKATAADAALQAENRSFNETLAGGKWNHLMALEPADQQWRGFRVATWKLPTFKAGPVRRRDEIVIDSSRFAARRGRDGSAWAAIPGLGSSGAALAVFPTTARGLAPGEAESAPELSCAVTLAAAGKWRLLARVLPTHPIVAGSGLRLAASLDGGPPRPLEIPDDDGSAAWADGVLTGYREAALVVDVPVAGAHQIHVYGLQPGVILDQVVLSPASGPN